MTQHDYQQDQAITEQDLPRWVLLGGAVLALLSLTSLGFGLAGWNAAVAGEAASQDLEEQIQASQESYTLLAKRLDRTEAANADLQADVGVVTDKLKLTQGELSRARAQAKQIREEYARQVSAMEESVRAELAEKAGLEEVGTLTGEVSSVRGDLEEAKKNLGLARGEMGTLIARNQEEIDQLRRLGERDYFEFSIDQKGNRQKLGTIVVELRGTNTKKNSFTVALYVDDMRLEKKNRSVNEPIYFYTRSSRKPLELVVNSVGKNKVAGYVSLPKASPTIAKAARD